MIALAAAMALLIEGAPPTKPLRYAVPFTLGELDSTLGNAGAIVADRCDGEPLDATTGPLRLIIPGESRPARSARQLERLLVIKIPTGA